MFDTPSVSKQGLVCNSKSNVKPLLPTLFILALLSFSVVALRPVFAENEEDLGLLMNFYKDTCPQAEEIIKEQVKLLYKCHKNTVFSWLRNIFHDCAVQVFMALTGRPKTTMISLGSFGSVRSKHDLSGMKAMPNCIGAPYPKSVASKGILEMICAEEGKDKDKTGQPHRVASVNQTNRF